MIRYIDVVVGRDRSVKPGRIKVANEHESDTNVLVFSFDFEYTGNAYLVFSRDGQSLYTPIINGQYTVDMGCSCMGGVWTTNILISESEIVDGKLDKSKKTFVSDDFVLTIQDNSINIEDLEKQELPADLKLLYDDLFNLKKQIEWMIANSEQFKDGDVVLLLSGVSSKDDDQGNVTLYNESDVPSVPADERKEMITLTFPDGKTYETVDDKARKLLFEIVEQGYYNEVVNDLTVELTFSDTEQHNTGTFPRVYNPLLEVGKDYIVTWNGVEYKCTGRQAGFGELQAFVLGNVGGTDFGKELGLIETSEPFAILFNLSYPDLNGMVHALDGSTSATLSIVASKKTVIKNKYLDIFGEVNEKVILPDFESTIEQDKYFIIDQALKLETDKKYIVTWNGVEYECICHSFDNDGVVVRVLGNLDAANGTGNTGEPFIIMEIPNEGSIGMALDGSTSVMLSITRSDALKIKEELLPDSVATKEDLEELAENIGTGGSGGGGKDGVSPTVSITDIDGGHKVTITDAEGVKDFDVMDGQDGQNGQNGKDGADGYTPVKGTDYFTETDKAEMIEQVMSEIEIPDGGSGGAKSKKIAEITIEELVASVTITLDENYHRLVVYWIAGANGEAKIVNESGTAVSQNLYVFINTTSAGYTERRIGGIKGSDKTWKNDILVIDFTHDCKRLVGSYTSEVRIDYTANAIATLTAQNSFLNGNEVVAPLKGNTLNFVPQSGGYLNKTTKLFVWGEYYEGVQA